MKKRTKAGWIRTLRRKLKLLTEHTSEEMLVYKNKGKWWVMAPCFSCGTPGEETLYHGKSELEAFRRAILHVQEEHNVFADDLEGSGENSES